MFMIVVGKGGYRDNADDSDGDENDGSDDGGMAVVALKMTVVHVSWVAIRESGIKFCFLAIKSRDLNYNKLQFQ